MTAELQTANNPHNHPPICCCLSDAETRTDTGCPACPYHGVQPPTVECPQCHQPAGRPHTEYCPLRLEADPWHAPLSGIEVRARCGYPRDCHGDGRGCGHDDCPKHGSL